MVNILNVVVVIKFIEKFLNIGGLLFGQLLGIRWNALEISVKEFKPFFF